MPTADASKWTIEQRTEVLCSVRQIASGGDSSAQLAAEVKALTQTERDNRLSSQLLSLPIMPWQSRLTSEFLGTN